MPEKPPETQPLSRKERFFTVFTLLSKAYPAAFGEIAVPLKKGIHFDVLGQQDQLGLSSPDILFALKYYTSSRRYLNCLRVGQMRVDLDGHPSGEVTEAESSFAKATLKQWAARLRAKEEQKGQVEQRKNQGREATEQTA